MLSDLQHASSVGRASSSSPLLMVPNHYYNNGNNSNNSQFQQQVAPTDYFPTTTPRYDSQYSLHEDVANFLNCIRLAFLNPYTQLDDNILSQCIGFTRHFPLVAGITTDIFGGPVNHYNEYISTQIQQESSLGNNTTNDGNIKINQPYPSYTNVTDSQQKMLLWMQGLQQRIEEATARNLDVAAAAFGPCEEARRDRGVSGRADVEAVRDDLEWWMEQHEQLELRLRRQREYLKRMQSDITLVSSITNSSKTNGNNNGSNNSTKDQEQMQQLRSAFYRANDLQQHLLATGAGGANNMRNTINLVEDVATLSRSVSASLANHNNNNNNNNNNNKSTTTSRSNSALTNNNEATQQRKTVSSKDVAQGLNYELLALQATTYRAESIAETREKLVKAVFSLGIHDYGEGSYVRTATNTNRFL